MVNKVSVDKVIAKAVDETDSNDEHSLHKVIKKKKQLLDANDLAGLTCLHSKLADYLNSSLTHGGFAKDSHPKVKVNAKTNLSEKTSHQPRLNLSEKHLVSLNTPLTPVVEKKIRVTLKSPSLQPAVNIQSKNKLNPIVDKDSVNQLNVKPKKAAKAEFSSLLTASAPSKETDIKEAAVTLAAYNELFLSTSLSGTTVSQNKQVTFKRTPNRHENIGDTKIILDTHKLQEPYVKPKKEAKAEFSSLLTASVPSKETNIKEAAVTLAAYNKLFLSTSLSETTGSQNKQVIFKRTTNRHENIGDTKIILDTHKLQEPFLVKNEPQVSSQKTPTTLQKLQTQAKQLRNIIPMGNGAIQLDYAFKSLSGNQSVVVNIAANTGLRHNIALYPSDIQAANLLSQNLGDLAGHSAELFQPEQDSDERRNRFYSEQDEEQE